VKLMYVVWADSPATPLDRSLREAEHRPADTLTTVQARSTQPR
jgi:hypothetical protein